jgi:ATPase subunit of ABC transporter with duplicated ATPase domains
MLAHTPLRARAGAGGDRGSGGRGGGRPNRRDLTPDPHPPQNTPPPPPPAPKAEAATPAAAAEDDDDATPSATLASSKKGGGKKAAAAAAAAAQTVSSGVRLEGVSITFKNATLLKDVTWDCKKGDRVGLVGVNCAGKTTQLQLITGVLTPDAGVIARQSANMKIAHLTQEFDVVPTRTVREEFMSAYADETAVLDRTEAVQLALEAVGSDMDAMGPLLDELQELTAKAAALDVGTMDKKVDAMMPQLGFGPDDNDRLVASYSGGWQMRMCLGKLLLQDPDLILLDEPTNHLDLGAIEWLETRLQTVTVPMVIVSHDREFLDRLCTKIVETEAGVATTYKGNYSAYVAAKAERTAAGWVAFERWQKEVSRQKDMADRLAGGAQAGRAVAAQREVDRLLGADRVDKPFTAKKRDFGFPPAESLGQRVLTIDSLRHGYGGRLLFDDVNLEIEKGERVAIIGPNGAGKSTLLRLIMGQEAPEAGAVELGAHGVTPNYFEQNQADALAPTATALETLERAAPDAKLPDVKALLGRMGFGGKAAHKRVSVLSGGEKARLALAKFMLAAGTLLVLDEPTNHLDIPSKETLEAALNAFDGAVIAVSHDRYFLRRVATRVIAVEGCSLVDYEGDYSRFLDKNARERGAMAKKEARAKEVAQSQIKAKSKLSKAEKMLAKKDKAKAFADGGGGAKKASKNAKRWS